MSNRKTVTRFAAAAVALPLAVSTVFIAPAAHAAPSAKPAASYTASQVAKHNKATDCWTIVGKNVYNVTKWIPRHPGGKSSIIGLCGKNGTAKFTAIHSGSAKAKATLAGYKIGTLK